MLDKVVTVVNWIIPLEMGQQLFADPVFILQLMCICIDKVKDVETAALPVVRDQRSMFVRPIVLLILTADFLFLYWWELAYCLVDACFMYLFRSIFICEKV